MQKVNVGVIGCGGRGWALLHTICDCENANCVAVCDGYDDRLVNAGDFVENKTGIRPSEYKNYEELLSDKNVQAVVIALPWEMHVQVAIASMRAGKITATEVGGAYDVQDCWDLVKCYEETKTPFMFLENCCFDKFELLALSLHRAGKFGKVVYCHGAYNHELRSEVLGGNVNRHYRLNDYTLRNCENYPTHELGPIAKLLNINNGNKMLSLSSVATKSGVGLEEFLNDDRCPDKSLKGRRFNQGDIVFTTIKCLNGEVITLRLDTTLPAFYDREFTVKGTGGFCNQTANMVVLDDKTNNFEEFYEPEKSLEKYFNSANNYCEYLPDCWKNITEHEKTLGHGGMDYIMLKRFFDCIIKNEDMPIDVYDAASWMCITPLSEQSISQGGAIKDIPDFTRGKYMKRKVKDVLPLNF